MSYQSPKGTFDILPYDAPEPWQQSSQWQTIEEKIRNLSALYSYQEIRTPIYESASLFDRGVGETSDIVTKEMFTFEDKGGRLLTLRPEGTSSVMRSFLEHRLFQKRPFHKFFYIGPMFRYERPQSGRYRQHHQFGVEAIGNPSADQDAEVIDLLFEFYRELGLKNLQVHINSVGDFSSRTRFKEALIHFLKPHFAHLSEESQIRLEKNPLRILDSKNPTDRSLLEGAPSLLSFLSEESKEHFDLLRRRLDQLQIPYVINDRIVRGLDYYQKTVFEVLTQDLGAQNTIGAGGRFDGLLATFGGPDLPAVGFATGLERVLQVLSQQSGLRSTNKGPCVYFVPLGDEARSISFFLAKECRRQKISTEIEPNGKKIQQALQNAQQMDATYCAILGSEEIAQQIVQLKHLKTREQKMVPWNLLPIHLKELSHG